MLNFFFCLLASAAWNAGGECRPSVIIMYFLSYGILRDSAGLVLPSSSAMNCYYSFFLLSADHTCKGISSNVSYDHDAFGTTVLLLFNMPLCAHLLHVGYSGILVAF